jgi:hypothetical protein
MSQDLTVIPDHKVAVSGSSIVISDAEAVTIVCAHCGLTKNVIFHCPPDPDVTKHDAYTFFRECRCHRKTQQPESVRQALTELHTSMRWCESVDDARNLVQSLISAEAPKEMAG